MSIRRHGASHYLAPCASHAVNPSPCVPVGLQKALEHIAQAEQLLTPCLRSLTTQSRRRVPKMRRGGERFVLSLVHIAASNPTLKALQVEPSPMAEALEKARILAPLTMRLQNLCRSLEDTLLAEKGEAWSQALKVYGISRWLAEHDPMLAAEMAPLKRFLKLGSRSRKRSE